MRCRVFETVIVVGALAASSLPGSAAVLRSATFGCKEPSDAKKVAANAPDLAALKASRACIPFAKGIQVDVDEDKPPLSCIRLKGDLECWWVPDPAVDEFPGQTADKPGRSGGRHHP